MSSGGGHAKSGDIELPGLHDLHTMLEGSSEKAGIHIPGWLLMALYVAMMLVFAAYVPVQSALNWNLALLLGPIWMPVLFGRFALLRFLQMRRSLYNYENKFVLLEIRIPREILKTPAAMETVFRSLNLGPGEGTWLKKYWWGRTRPWWSFELASFGGEIHFFVYTRTNMRRALESYIYAQYPEVEIIEAADYSRLRDPSHEPYKMFACEYMPPSTNHYPIATYVDYELDKPGIKPELQVNPLAQVLEILGSIGPGEEIWTQIMIRFTKNEFYRGKKKPDGSLHTWKDDAKAMVEQLKKASINKRQTVDAEGHVQDVEGFPNPTEGTKYAINALEKKMEKSIYDVGIRSIYSAPADKWASMNPFVANIFKPFGIKPANLWSEKFLDYPWEDVGGKRQAHEMHEVVEFYRARSYFYPPYRGPWMTMSTEELATIYHIPSSIVKTPSLPRIQSVTSAAPANLPQ